MKLIAEENSVSIEILKSESLRIKVVIGITSFFIFLNAAILLFFEERLEDIFGYNFPIQSFLLIMCCFTLYETLVLKIISFFIKRNKNAPNLPRYINAFIEVSLPSFVLITFMEDMEPSIALNSPVVFAYFLFIILSILRMGYRISAFTGFVAAIEYYLLYFFYGAELSPALIGIKYFSSPSPILFKSLMLIFAGTTSGFVASQIRKSLHKTLESTKEKNEIMNVFGQHVSPEIVNQLIGQEKDMPPQMKYICVMFLDIRDFTTFSEAKSPKEVVEYLNTLFGEFMSIINRNNGIVNKFLGDGFMALFGAPLSDEGKDIHNAVKASKEIIERLEEMNQQDTIPPTRIGIGLHAGEAMVGNVGSHERKEYTIIGDTVNLASRIEGLNKKYDSVCLVSKAVNEKLPEEWQSSKIDSVQVKGRQEEIDIYRLH